MIVVADTSPFVALVSIGHVDLLPSLFGRVTVPPEVAVELNDPKRTGVVRAFIASPPLWLDVRSPASIEPIAGLHAGEAAAIALATELRADRLVIDETLGRQAATERNVKVIGTVGILEAAAQRRLIDLDRAFEKLKQTDFWVSHKFLDDRLSLFHEQERKTAIAEQSQREQSKAMERSTRTERDKDHEPER